MARKELRVVVERQTSSHYYADQLNRVFIKCVLLVLYSTFDLKQDVLYDDRRHLVNDIVCLLGLPILFLFLVVGTLVVD